MPISVILTDQEASFFIAMREARLFDLRNVDIVFHLNSDGVLTDIMKPEGKKIPWYKFVFIYKRKKALDKLLL